MSDLTDFIRHVHDPQTKALGRARARVRELETERDALAAALRKECGSAARFRSVYGSALAPAEQEGQR